MAQKYSEILDLYVQGLNTAMNNAAHAKNATGEGGVMFEIREKSGKKYVQATQNVLSGDDPVQWGKQIESYINDTIRNGEDVVFPTDDGHILILTARSAYKLSDRHISAVAQKVEAFLDDESYFRKGIIATHIDEIIQVAKFAQNSEDIGGKHENDIGEDGFNYFTAFFMDFDGEYYRVKFSSALNEEQETVYSIGEVRKRKFPSRGGSSPNGALKNGGKSSNPIIYTSEDKSQDVKTDFQLALEKILKAQMESGDNGKKMNQSRDEIAYKYFVKYNNTESAQRVIDRATNAAFADSKVRGKNGKLRKVYHWTNNDFYTFDTGRSGKNQGKTHGDGIYISTSPDEFSYAGRKRMELYANITNPFEMQLTNEQAKYILDKYAATKHNLDKYDGLYRNHAMAALTSPVKVFDYLDEYAADNGIKVSDILKDLGYDGVHDGSEWVAFDSEQLKSAEPITYDDNSNYISLAKRFDTSKSDIRYQSRKDTDYLSAVERGDMATAQKMVDEAAERAFSNSKIRGEDGKLIKVYHGTDADFTVFDRTMGRATAEKRINEIIKRHQTTP